MSRCGRQPVGGKYPPGKSVVALAGHRHLADVGDVDRDRPGRRRGADLHAPAGGGDAQLHRRAIHRVLEPGPGADREAGRLLVDQRLDQVLEIEVADRRHCRHVDLDLAVESVEREIGFAKQALEQAAHRIEERAEHVRRDLLDHVVQRQDGVGLRRRSATGRGACTGSRYRRRGSDVVDAPGTVIDDGRVHAVAQRLQVAIDGGPGDFQVFHDPGERGPLRAADQGVDAGDALCCGSFGSPCAEFRFPYGRQRPADGSADLDVNRFPGSGLDRRRQRLDLSRQPLEAFVLLVRDQGEERAGDVLRVGDVDRQQVVLHVAGRADAAEAADHPVGKALLGGDAHRLVRQHEEGAVPAERSRQAAEEGVAVRRRVMAPVALVDRHVQPVGKQGFEAAGRPGDERAFDVAEFSHGASPVPRGSGVHRAPGKEEAATL